MSKIAKTRWAIFMLEPAPSLYLLAMLAGFPIGQIIYDRYDLGVLFIIALSTGLLSIFKLPLIRVIQTGLMLSTLFITANYFGHRDLLEMIYAGLVALIVVRIHFVIIARYIQDRSRGPFSRISR